MRRVDGGRAAPVGWSSLMSTHTRCRLAGPCDPLDEGWKEGGRGEGEGGGAAIVPVVDVFDLLFGWIDPFTHLLSGWRRLLLLRMLYAEVHWMLRHAGVLLHTGDGVGHSRLLHWVNDIRFLILIDQHFLRDRQR